jgi:hypothetical protein
MVIYKREAQRRAFQEAGTPDDPRWYDQNRSTLTRPLTPPQRQCDGMPPSWNLRRI